MSTPPRRTETISQTSTGRSHTARCSTRGRAAQLLLTGALLLGCAPGARAPTGEFIPPATPDEREGFIAVTAENPTVRPERRDFSEEQLAQLRMPAGFRIAVFARDLEQPRGITAGADGDVYVAEREPGQVRLLRDSNGDGIADVSRVVATGLGEGLSGVHGLAIQRLRRADRRTRHDGAGEPGQLGARDLRRGVTEHNRLRLAPDDTAVLGRGSQQRWAWQ